MEDWVHAPKMSDLVNSTRASMGRSNMESRKRIRMGNRGISLQFLNIINQHSE